MRELGSIILKKEVENGHFFEAVFNAKAQRGKGAKRKYFNHGWTRILSLQRRIRLRLELRRDEGVKTEGNEGNNDGTVAGSAVGATSL
jgi:hypothetical protein